MELEELKADKQLMDKVMAGHEPSADRLQRLLERAFPEKATRDE